MEKLPSNEHQQLNSCFNFIRPSTPPEELEKKERPGTFSFNHSTSSVNNDNNKGRTFLQINADALRIVYSLPEHDDKIDSAISHQFHFPHLKRLLLSPTPLHLSYTSSSPIMFQQKPAAIPINDEDDAADPTGKSPAATFLAKFMSPVATDSAFNTSYQTEESTLIENYRLGETIGFGGFSTVRKAHHVRTGKLTAVKIIQHPLINASTSSRLERELSIWRSLDHPNIVYLQKVIHKHEKKVSYLFNDYCSGGNLLDYLNKCKQTNEIVARRLFKELCQGIYYLHVNRRICHKDLKLENILLDDNGHIKICDFGLAIEIPRLHHHHSHKKARKQDEHAEEIAGGSLAYAAPEQIRKKTALACRKTDIWSLGVILYTLTVGSLPFMDDYDLRLQQKILKGQFEIPKNIVLSNTLKELICGCLAYEPDKRFNINQILQSAWLNS